MRERDLAEANKAKEQEDFSTPPPPPEEPEPEPEVMGEKVVFDPENYTKDEYRFQKFPKFRDTNDFSEAKSFFKLNRNNLKKGMFKFAKDLIPKSLLMTSNAMNKEAINGFKSIQGWMRDRSISFPESGIQELISQITDHPELRNEMYCQVMKQLTANPKKESQKQGWMIMALLCEHVPPSDNLLNYVLNFINEHIDGPYDTDIAQYALYSIKVLETTSNKFKDINFVPKKPNIGHISFFRDRTMEAGDVEICFPDGSTTILNVNPWDSNAELIPRICEKVNIKDQDSLKIFELKAAALTLIPMEQCVLDVKAAWGKTEEEDEESVKKKKKTYFLPNRKNKDKNDEPEINRLVLTLGFVRMPLQLPTCEVKQALVAAQHMRDLTMGAQKITKEEAVNFGAMHKYLLTKGGMVPIGDAIETPLPNQTNLWDREKLWGVPSNMVKKFKGDEFGKAVEAALGAQDVTKIDYLELISQQRMLFGAQFFRVMNLAVAGMEKYPPYVEIAINHRGLIVLNTASREVLDQWPLLQVMGWSHTPVKIKLKVKLSRKVGGKSADTLNFTTSHSPNMAKYMCELLLAYATEMINAINAQKKAKKAAKK